MPHDDSSPQTPEAKVSFAEWLADVTPSWSWHCRHLAHVRGYLDQVTSGRLRRLMLFLPPRHGKSEMTTVRYSVFRLEHAPEMRVILGAYNQTLANRFSRKARRLARERVFLNSERVAVEEWETVAGGGLRAAGVGAGITGLGGHLIVIDDPIKSREEANSPAYREKVWEWYKDDLYTRLEPGGAIVLIMTRWHEDDLAGRILDSDDAENWTVVSLPAEAEEGDPLGRQPGEALWPERFDRTALREIRVVLGNSYYALYQQRPTAPEGEFFKRAWFEIVAETPAQARRVRYWDKAGTQGGGHYTAGVLMACADGIFYVEDVVMGQWAAGEREPIIRQTAELDGRDVRVWVEQEPGSGGKESAEATIRNLRGFAVFADRVTGDKVVRAEPMQAQAMAGNVKLKKGPWNRSFLEILSLFPQGKIKDPVDAAAGALNKLAVVREARIY